ncbi:hypothetical protein SteCoe_27042 [Stentor coeruleus]|uniref:EGF-like domain-containing protein n=1 Tax=Stentor coeruleus TaxID=5963 RepID=A0A1R2BBI5_9CILI|nr:hypothetical protein SteCoe_27042 [Stentor coeruleus]
MIFAFLSFAVLISLVSGDFFSFENIYYSFPGCEGTVVLRSDSGEVIDSNLEVFIFLYPPQVIEEFTGSITIVNGVGDFSFAMYCMGSYVLQAQSGIITGESDWIYVDDDECYSIDYIINADEFYVNTDFTITGEFNHCEECYLTLFEISGDKIEGDTYLEFLNGDFESTLKIAGPGDKRIMIILLDSYSMIVLETYVPGFISYSYPESKPTKSNEVFSIKIEVFAENYPEEVSTDGFFEIEVEVYNQFDLRRLDDSSSFISGTLKGTTVNGQLILNNLKFLVPDEYYLYVWNSELDYPDYETITIAEGDGVSIIIVSASTDTLKLGQILSVTVSLFQDDGLFTEEAEITLEGTGLSFIGDNKAVTNTGSAVFYVSFASLGKTVFTATSSKDFNNVEVESFTVYSVDPLCETLDDNGNCLECIYLADFTNGLCECYGNSFYDEPYCFCDDGYVDNLIGNCELCSNQFSDKDLKSYYNVDYNEIIVMFSENVVNSTDNCENFVVMPDFYQSLLIQCIWVNSESFALIFSEQLPAQYFELKIDSNLKPMRELCNIKDENVYVTVDIIYDLPIPEIEIVYPSYISIPCLDSNAVIMLTIISDDYEYNWEAISSNPSLVNSVAEQSTSVLVLDKTLLNEEELVIYVTVRSILYETEASETIQIKVTNEMLLTIGFNHGSQISMKSSSPLFIKAQILSSCNIDGPYLYDWSYSSDSLIDLYSLEQNSPKPDGIYFPAYTFAANSIYTITVNVTSNSTNSYGVAQIKIDVSLDELKFSINKWSGTIGTANDLEIIAYAEDTDYTDSSITYVWYCSEGSEECIGNNGNALYSSTSGDKLTISNDQLRDGAIYLFQVTASTAQKSSALQVEFTIDEGVRGYANIPSIKDKIKNRRNTNLISEVIPFGDCKFNWIFEPNLNSDSSIYLDYPFLSIPQNALEEGKTYKITLQVSSDTSSTSAVYTYISRSSIPTCDSFTVEYKGNKYYLEGVGCSSPQKYLTYQFGYANADDKVYWVTSATPISSVLVYLGDDLKAQLMNVCDEYECMLYSNSANRLQRRQLNTIDDFSASIENNDDIPNAVIYYIQKSDSQTTYDTIVYTMGDYFYSEIIDDSNIDLFISCLSSVFNISDYVNTEITTYLKNLTVSTLERFPDSLSNTQAENIVVSFAPFISKLNYTDLHELSSTIRNLWFKNKLPGESILNVEGIFALYGNRVLSSDLQGSSFSIAETTVSIPLDLQVDSSAII